MRLYILQIPVRTGNLTRITIFTGQTIADGIRDKNVLGFDPYKVLTFKDKDVRKVVALEKAKAQTEEEAISDPIKSKVYYQEDLFVLTFCSPCPSFFQPPFLL